MIIEFRPLQDIVDISLLEGNKLNPYYFLYTEEDEPIDIPYFGIKIVKYKNRVLRLVDKFLIKK